jgi:hypothetical protein
MADLWSDYTDMLITQFDATSGKGLKISVRDFLTDPLRFASEPEIKTSIASMRKSLNDFIDSSIKNVADQKARFETTLQNCDAATTMIAQSIATRAKQNKVPVIKPVSIERGATEDIINVNEGGPEINALIDKLLANSYLVADFTREVNGKKVGSWLFSGQSKNYSLNIYMPYNEYKSLQDSKAEIGTLFDAASQLMAP